MRIPFTDSNEFHLHMFIGLLFVFCLSLPAVVTSCHSQTNQGTAQLSPFAPPNLKRASSVHNGATHSTREAHPTLLQAPPPLPPSPLARSPLSLSAHLLPACPTPPAQTPRALPPTCCVDVILQPLDTCARFTTTTPDNQNTAAAAVFTRPDPAIPARHACITSNTL